MREKRGRKNERKGERSMGKEKREGDMLQLVATFFLTIKNRLIIGLD